MVALRILCVFLSALMLLNAQGNGALTAQTQKMIAKANKDGPYLGLVIPNLFELNPLLQSPNYTSSDQTIDIAGITTQLLLSFFNVEGVVHYGVAGTVNPSINRGDVTIAEYWGHTALWSWQRYGQGPEDELTLESNGDYTREFGIPIDGTPEEREHAFWVSVDPLYFEISKQLEGLVLEGCINSTTSLSETPKVTIVQRGTSARISLSNAAYRSFIYKKFNVSPVDMESASVALICLQQRKPFVAFRAISGSPDRGSADSNDHDDTFISLAANNSVTVVLEFINLLSTNSTLSTSFAHIS